MYSIYIYIYINGLEIHAGWRSVQVKKKTKIRLSTNKSMYMRLKKHPVYKP